MRIVHLMASPFYGGPERQMLGLARHLPPDFKSVFLTFAERGNCQAFLEQVHQYGFEGLVLENNMPHVRACIHEVAAQLRTLKADILICSGYKPDIIGWRAARKVGIPVVAVAHGWTAATLKVRFNETIDRIVMRWMDAVVCVSEAQARRVRRALVPQRKIEVIRNAIAGESFAEPDPTYGDKLRDFFERKPKRIVGAAGRLSPEKGFEIMVDAAAIVAAKNADIGFIHFGDGPEREAIKRSIAAKGLTDLFILAGFRTDVARFLPHLDLMVLPSYTEGLPVVLLEAFAAGVPAVATAVGGTPEVIEEGQSGYLVRPGDPGALAQRILDSLQDEGVRRAMGRHGKRRAREDFSFERQSETYQRLFCKLFGEPGA